MGLLLLRAAIGACLVVHGGACLVARDHEVWTWVAAPLAIVSGALLLIGALTPIAGVLGVAICAGSGLLPSHLFGLFGCAPSTLLIVVMAVAVILLGPGAFSLDARWFGRREVVIPHRPHQASED